MSEVEFTLGHRVRELRKERGLSQRELAERAGLSPNAISLIEREEISPSVATLQRLAGAFGVKMGYFFETEPEALVLHVRPGERAVIRGEGLSIESLAARLPGQQMEPYLITLAPRADIGVGHVAHEGHEFVFCLAGQLCYEIDGKDYRLGSGDFLLFEAGQPHRWDNPGEVEAQLLLVLVSPGDVDEPARRHFPAYPSLTHLA